MASLQTFPREVLIRICSFLDQRTLFCLRGRTDSRSEEPLQATRLARAAGDYLFEEILIAPRPVVLQAACNIAFTPHLAGKVKRIIYDNSCYDQVLAGNVSRYIGAVTFARRNTDHNHSDLDMWNK
jgi:hypothetical protein